MLTNNPQHKGPTSKPARRTLQAVQAVLREDGTSRANSLALAKIDEVIRTSDVVAKTDELIDALIKTSARQQQQLQHIVVEAKEFKNDVVSLHELVALRERQNHHKDQIMGVLVITFLVIIVGLTSFIIRRGYHDMNVWTYLNLFPHTFGIVLIGVIIFHLLALLVLRMKGVPFRPRIERTRKSGEKFAADLLSLSDYFQTDSFRCVGDYQKCKAARLDSGDNVVCIIGYVVCQITLILSKIKIRVSIR
jgi:hypothetical protein